MSKWIPAEERKPADFVSVLGHMTDAGEFPSVMERAGVEVKVGNVSTIHYAVSCLICGETIRYIEYPTNIPEVCDKCKAAVMKMRENLERDPLQPILDSEVIDHGTEQR